MYSDLECGICFRTYNAGRRCPRELRCKHSFCESCLLAISRPRAPDGKRPGADRSIACPLCRQTTSISGAGRVKAELRVDEWLLERALAAGVLDRDEEDEPGEGDGRGGEGAEPLGTPAEESDSPGGSRCRRLRRTWKNVWRKISGGSARRGGGESRWWSAPSLTSCHVSVVQSGRNCLGHDMREFLNWPILERGLVAAAVAVVVVTSVTAGHRLLYSLKVIKLTG